MKHRFQRYIVRMEILSTFAYESNTLLSENTPLKSMGQFRDEKPPKPPLPLGYVDPSLIHPSLDRPAHYPKRHPDLISRFATDHFPDRQTHRPTEWSMRLGSMNTGYDRYTDRERHDNNNRSSPKSFGKSPSPSPSVTLRRPKFTPELPLPIRRSLRL